MIKVIIQMGPPLSQLVGESKVILSMAPKSTLADALEEMQARHPDFMDGLRGKGLRKSLEKMVYYMYVNYRSTEIGEAGRIVLADGDRIRIFLPVAGGE